MTIQAVLLPLFVEVTLTFVLLLWAGFLRVDALRSGAVAHRSIALRELNWPPRTTQVANAFQNQLELPVLFYVLVILAWITRHADILFVTMSWLFVVFRLLHAYIHVTSNNLRQRGPVFGIGAVVLMLMWVIFMVRILLGVG
jgi:hypothetical protein